jgi:hypothetical protein
MEHRVETSTSPSSRLQDVLPIVAALLLVLYAGLAHGRVTGRWQSNAALARAATRLPLIPDTIGEWSGIDVTKNPEELAIAEAAAYLCRRYRHSGTGQEVTVLLLCGPTGPISVHPPTACYRARGYQLLDEPQETTVESEAGLSVFRLAEFQGQSTLTEDRVALMWGWSVAGPWSAPDSPRLEFAGEPVLHKLYITWDRSRDQRPVTDTLPSEFVELFLPVVQSVISSPPDRFPADAASHAAAQ